MATWNPLTNITSSALIPTANAKVLRKTALDVLEKSRHFGSCCFDDAIGKQEGRKVVWYRPQNFAAAGLTIAVEGDIPSGLTYSNREVTAVLGNYSDWVGVSTFLMDTSPTPDLQDASERLGYRGALRVDNLTRAVIDAEYIGMQQAALAPSGMLRVADLRAARTLMKNQDVKPMKASGNRFRTVISPVIGFDVINDPNIGGYGDIVKFNQNVTQTPLVNYDMDDGLMDIAGCRILESTNVKTVVSGSTTSYYTYIIGEGAFGAVTMSARMPKVGNDPQKARFNLYMGKGGPGPWDPTGEMGGFASYNFYYSAVCADGNPSIGGVYRGRIISTTSSIA
jgi:N4-gp56 family major capsid protein